MKKYQLKIAKVPFSRLFDIQYSNAHTKYLKKRPLTN